MPKIRTAPEWEPSWHRNARARRSRARQVARAAKQGAQVDSERLAAAQVLLSAHHGTRGSNDGEMGKGGKHKIAQNDWCCKNKGCNTNPRGDRHFNFAKKNTCFLCGDPEPKNPVRYKDTKEGKLVLANGVEQGPAEGVAQLSPKLREEAAVVAMLGRLKPNNPPNRSQAQCVRRICSYVGDKIGYEQQQ